MKIQHKGDPIERRRQAYPPIGDQLDAIGKLAKALRDQGMYLPAEVEAWIDQLSTIKARYPK